MNRTGEGGILHRQWIHLPGLALLLLGLAAAARWATERPEVELIYS